MRSLKTNEYIHYSRMYDRSVGRSILIDGVVVVVVVDDDDVVVVRRCV